MAAVLWLSTSLLSTLFINPKRKWARKDRDDAISSIELLNLLFDKVVVDDSSHAFRFLENHLYQKQIDKLENASKILNSTLKQDLINCFNPLKH